MSIVFLLSQVSCASLRHPGKSLAVLWRVDPEILRKLCAAVPKQQMRDTLPIFLEEAMDFRPESLLKPWKTDGKPT